MSLWDTVVPDGDDASDDQAHETEPATDPALVLHHSGGLYDTFVDLE